MVERCDATHNSCLELFTQCRGETVWKIAGRPLEGALLAPGGANRLLFAPSWRPYSPRFGTHSEFPNSFPRTSVNRLAYGSVVARSRTECEASSKAPGLLKSSRAHWAPDTTRK